MLEILVFLKSFFKPFLFEFEREPWKRESRKLVWSLVLGSGLLASGTR